jgi:hypothetical protein
MSPLPKRPNHSDPIPNKKIPNGPEQYTVKGPYWDAVIEGDLAVTPQGELELVGYEGNGDPDTQMQGPWFMIECYQKPK